MLKDGASVLAAPVAELDQERIIRAMVGRPLSAVFPASAGAPGGVVLEVESLGQRGHFEDVSFAVRAGEIVGMFGLVGSGRTELAKAIFGARPADAGRVRLGGRDARFATPAEAVRRGVAMLTEDRKGDGLVLDLSVLDNVGLASFAALLAARGHRRPAARPAWSAPSSTSCRSGRATPPGRCGSSPAATSRRWCSPSGCWSRAPSSSSSTSRPAASTSRTRVEIYRMIRDLADRRARRCC